MYTYEEYRNIHGLAMYVFIISSYVYIVESNNKNIHGLAMF